MIKKPESKDFRESTTVKVLRGSGAAAKEAGTAIPKLLAKCFLGFNAVALLIGGLGTGGGAGILMLLTGIGFVAIVFRSRIFGKKSPRAKIDINDAETRHVDDRSINSEERTGAACAFNYDTRSVLNKALPCFLFGALLLIVPSFFARLFTLALFLYAGLLIVRALRTGVLLSFDEEKITVSGNSGFSTILWQDVKDVDCHSYRRTNLFILFAIGTRRVLRIRAHNKRLETDDLLVPIDFLGLDEDELVKLVARFLTLRAAAGVTANLATITNNRSCIDNKTAAHQQKAAQKDGATSFDPNVNISQYLKDRDQTIAQIRPEVIPTKAKTVPRFGRKIAGG